MVNLEGEMGNMKSNKIFHISELAFNLPDDFDGGILDALKLLVEYIEKKEKENSISIIKDRDRKKGFCLDLLQEHDSSRCFMNSIILEQEDKLKEWEIKEDIGGEADEH